MHDFQGLLIKFFMLKFPLFCLWISRHTYMERAAHQESRGTPVCWESLQSIYLFYLNQPPPSITSYYSWLTSVSWISPFSLEKDSSINQETELVAFFLLAFLSLSLSLSYLFSLFTFQLLTYDYSFLPFALKFSSFPRVVIIRVELLNYCSLKVSETFEE